MSSARPRRQRAGFALSRRRLIAGGVGLGLIGLGATAATRELAEAAQPDPVRSVTVAYTRSGRREGLDAEAARSLPDGSRVVPGAAVAAPARRQREFLTQRAAWLEHVPEARRGLATSALLDLWVLSDGLPATVAGWVGPWRYIWPRDTAFAAVALARVGAVRQAWSQLLYLQSIQAVDGSFAARVVPDQGCRRTTGNRSSTLSDWCSGPLPTSLLRRNGPLSDSTSTSWPTCCEEPPGDCSTTPPADSICRRWARTIGRSENHRSPSVWPARL